MNANEKVIKALKYIDDLEFKSYSEFVHKAINDGKFVTIKNALGELLMYTVVCEKCGEKIDESYAEMLSN